MVNKRWLIIVIIGWFILNLVGTTTVMQSGKHIIIWMVIQQVWLIAGGLFSIKDLSILRGDINDVRWGVVAGIGLFIFNTGLNLCVVFVFNRLFGQEQVDLWLTQEHLGIDRLLESGVWWLTSGLIIIGAPLGEELLFRGAFLSSLRVAITDKWAILISAVCFALVHFYMVQFIPVLASGIILGFLFTSNNNLVRPVIAHAVVNAISLVFYNL